MSRTVIPLFGDAGDDDEGRRMESSRSAGVVGSSALVQSPDGLDQEDAVSALVDGVVLSHRDRPGPGAGSREVLPSWARSRSAFIDAAAWQARHWMHVLAFHAVRLPLYWLRLVFRSPVGLGRVLARTWRWAIDADGGMVRASLSSSGGDADVFVRVTQQRRQVVRGRVSTTLFALTGVVVGGWVAVLWLAPSGRAAAAAAVLSLLGLAGRSVDHPVTSRAVDSEAVPKLTADLILTALGSLGIGELNKGIRGATAGAGVKFPSPIVRDGPGWRADVDLPPGVTAGDVIERRDRLASGLRRPEGCVWPEGDQDAHAGRLVLWVGDLPMRKQKPVPWPLTKTGRVNIFEPFPIGVDPRGKTVTLTLMFASMVIGALPRMGKSFFLRLLLLAALDPTVRLYIFDLKGGADMLALEPVAFRFRLGDDADDIAYLLAAVRELHADMPRRYRTLRSLPKDICPEGKITPHIAADRPLGLFPVVLALDECQRAWENPTHGGEIEALTTDLAKRGPSVGIIVINATQRLDAKSLPPGIASNAILRFCLKVAGQLENDMVLGTSSYKAGVRATMFGRDDQGIGYLKGEGNDPTITRNAYIDAPGAETIVVRARAARIAAGLLDGHGAGIEPETATGAESILDHLATVWPGDETGVWSDDLATRLAATFPGLYSGWTGEQVTSAVKPHGLRSKQIKRTLDGQPVNRRGLTRQALSDALTARDLDWPNPPDPVVPPSPGPADTDRPVGPQDARPGRWRDTHPIDHDEEPAGGPEGRDGGAT